MTPLKIQNVKTRPKQSKCQNIILSKNLKTQCAYGLQPKCQRFSVFVFDLLTFWPAGHTGRAVASTRQNITRAYYYVIRASHSLAQLRVTSFPLLGKLCGDRCTFSSNQTNERKCYE